MRSPDPRRRRGSSAEDRERWKTVYEETPYEELPWFDPGPSRTVERAVGERFLPSRGVVLDVGCGAGSNVLYLAQNGFEAHGIDLSPAAVRGAEVRGRLAGVTIDVRVGDALDVGFPDHRFDGLVDIGCFHTLPLARRGDYAAEMARLLRPAGVFVLSWVAREHEGPAGPPHRPSLAEVTDVLEADFLFVRTGFHPQGEETGPPVYDAWLTRRTTPQPPRR